jgi:hypothetical protein
MVGLIYELTRNLLTAFTGIPLYASGCPSHCTVNINCFRLYSLKAINEVTIRFFGPVGSPT